MDKEDDALVMLRVEAIIGGGEASGATYNLVLQELTGRRRLMMKIGLPEAQSIAVQMEGVKMPRPLTHDLMAKMIASFGVSVSRVIIEDMHDGFFFSTIVCDKEGQPYFFDARTSDAVSLAIRCHAPIFAREHVMRFVSGRGPELGVVVEGEKGEKGEKKEVTVEELEKQLEEAVAEENYEEAQRLKEIIAERKRNDIL